MTQYYYSMGWKVEVIAKSDHYNKSAITNNSKKFVPERKTGSNTQHGNRAHTLNYSLSHKVSYTVLQFY